MFSVGHEEIARAALAALEEDVQRLRMERAARQAHRPGEPRTWRWRVEPGKESEFDHLRSWFLPGQQRALVETASADRDTPNGPLDRVHQGSAAHPTVRRLANPRRSSLVRASALLVGQAFSRMGRRLLEWSGEPA